MQTLLTAIALAMDSFALCIATGAVYKSIKLDKALLIACIFAIFQGIMPLFGFTFGLLADTFVLSFHKLIACIALVGVGIKFINDSRQSPIKALNLSFTAIFIGGFLTSIDALIVGISFGLKIGDIQKACILITIICFIFCLIGLNLGKKLATNYENKALLLGGVLLIFVGISSLF